MRQKIKDFIFYNASDEVIKRGKKLYKEGAVTYISYDADKKIHYFKVMGSQPYTVKIRISPKGDIETSCNCPFVWGKFVNIP